VKLNNCSLSPAFQTLRDLQNRQGQSHFRVFASLTQLLTNLEAKYARLAEYTSRYEELTAARTDTWLRFLGFNARRGLVINVTHLLTWLVGIWAVNTGQFQVGYLLVFLRWETLVFDFLSHYLVVHKQWMETSPALIVFFAELDETVEKVPVIPTAEVSAVELPVMPSPLEAG
jgi:ABC-type bacteriocin/lantibiotic exporter with double-glycine peptidase domain